MTEYSKYPSWIELNYRSQWAVHVQTICTLRWVEAASPGLLGQFNTHAGGLIDAKDMIDALLDVLKVFHKDTTTFDSVIIYNQPTEDDRPQPVRFHNLAVEGTNVGTGWAKAVQTTINCKSAAFNPFKLVLLDAPVPASFDKITTLVGNPELEALITELALGSNGWAARDGEQLAAFQSVTYDLNDKLRKEYGMA